MTRTPPTNLDVAELVEAARHVALSRDMAVIDRIRNAIATTSDPHELGDLHLALAAALQGDEELGACAAAAGTAARQYSAAGDLSAAAYASVVAAGFIAQMGDVAEGVERAVDAIIMLGDVVVGDESSIRTAQALSGFFFLQSGFDVAIEFAERAFRGAVRRQIATVDHIAYNLGYFAVEAVHQSDATRRDEATEHSDGADVRETRLALASEAADWLITRGSTPGARSVMGPGLAAEVCLARDEPADRAGLADGSSHYVHVPTSFAAWHRLVWASVERRAGNNELAIELLDLATPVLAASGDDHCLVRSLSERVAAKSALGDVSGALADANELARTCRSWQMGQADRLVRHVMRRIDLERTRHEASLTNQRLRRAMERQSITSEQRGALIAAIGHDLRSPLSSVTLAADLLLRSDELTLESRDLLKRLRDEALHAGDVLDDLAPQSSLGDHDATRHVEVDVWRTVATTVGRHVHHGHTIDFAEIPTDASAIGDPVLLGRILDNLVSNATKYAPPGSTIRIGTSERDGEQTIWVDDEGPGLPDAIRDTAFELSVRGPNASDAQGNGIGLFLVRTFAELQGGRAWWEPSPTGGSRFAITMPTAAPPVTEPEC
jgi:signal transduction histidine kinase